MGATYRLQGSEGTCRSAKERGRTIHPTGATYAFLGLAGGYVGLADYSIEDHFSNYWKMRYIAKLTKAGVEQVIEIQVYTFLQAQEKVREMVAGDAEVTEATVYSVFNFVRIKGQVEET